MLLAQHPHQPINRNQRSQVNSGEHRQPAAVNPQPPCSRNPAAAAPKSKEMTMSKKFAISPKDSKAFYMAGTENTGSYVVLANSGFGRVGERRGYYPAEGGREDAIVMARELAPEWPPRL